MCKKTTIYLSQDGGCAVREMNWAPPECQSVTLTESASCSVPPVRERGSLDRQRRVELLGDFTAPLLASVDWLVEHLSAN